MRSAMVHKRKRDHMDGETAMAFAGELFEQLHPRETCPEWLVRCTAISYHWHEDDNYVVSFAVTPNATNDAVSYFKVRVDPTTAETRVLLDTDVSEIVGKDLVGY
jgi:hypothetical protein